MDNTVPRLTIWQGLRARETTRIYHVSQRCRGVAARGSRRCLDKALAHRSSQRDRESRQFTAECLRAGLNELGYVDGRNADIVYRFAEEHLDRFPVLAAEVVGLKPDVILATVTPAAVATRALTKSIPIVCPLLADAINLGLIATDLRPGGNVTG